MNQLSLRTFYSVLAIFLCTISMKAIERPCTVIRKNIASISELKANTKSSFNIDLGNYVAIPSTSIGLILKSSRTVKHQFKIFTIEPSFKNIWKPQGSHSSKITSNLSQVETSVYIENQRSIDTQDNYAFHQELSVNTANISKLFNLAYENDIAHPPGLGQNTKEEKQPLKNEVKEGAKSNPSWQKHSTLYKQAVLHLFIILSG